MAILDISDLNLLLEVWRARSITGAVDRVGLSQPSISIRLGHLRQHFGDPLFVRTSIGMMPTPKMESLIPAIEQAAKLLGGQADASDTFVARSASRTFRVSFSNVGQMVMLPIMLRHFESAAPGVHLHAVDLGRSTSQLLEAGDADVAVGFTYELKAGFYQQTLFTESYLCIASARHSRIRDRLDVGRFLAEGHVAVDAPGTGYWLLDKAFEDQRIQRPVKARVPSFQGLVHIVENTDLIAVVPARLAQAYAERGRIRALTMPMPCPSYVVKQYWHERFHRDPGNRWLRQVIFDLFSNLPQAQATPGTQRTNRGKRSA